MDLDQVFTPKEIAEKLDVDYRTVLREINRGNLRARKIGKIYLITKDSLETYLNDTGVRSLKVSVAIVLHDDKVVLVKRKIEENNLVWQFPSGIVKYGEKTSTRGEIECLRETGVHCKAIRKLGYRVHPDTKVVIHYWLCDYLTGDLYNADPAENKEVKWVDSLAPERLFTSDYYTPVKKHLRKARN